MILTFSIKNISASIGNKTLLKKISFSAKQGDVIAIVGPNGIGKSTLLKAIMHHFNVKVDSGTITFNQKDITNLSTDQIAKLGLFYVAQNPIELEGIQNLEFLKTIYNAKNQDGNGFYQLYSSISKLLKELDLSEEILKMNVNVGFSGGQKKKNEVLQAQLFNPSMFLLDEIDSGLDVDAIQIISKFINEWRKKCITLVVSHHLDFLYKLKPNKVIVLGNQTIAKIGDISIVKDIEKNGYKHFNLSKTNHQDFEIVDPYLSCSTK